MSIFSSESVSTFLTRVLIFSFLLCVSIHLTYMGTDYALNRPHDETLWIWGDSQTYRGLDLDVLEQISGQGSLSFAFDGSSPYDFIRFAERVPVGSRVVIPLPQGFLMRPPKVDWNRNGWSYRGLWALFQHDYPLSEIYRVALQNLRPRRVLSRQHPLYSQRWQGKQLPTDLQKLWETEPFYFQAKAEIFRVGLSLLQRKHCQFMLIDYPVHPLLQHHIETVAWRQSLDDVQQQTIQAIAPQKYHLRIKSEAFYSNPVHLNVEGAQQLSSKVGKLLMRQPENVLLCTTDRCQTAL